jgi:hypothetical protein
MKGQNLNLAIPINDLKPIINTNLNITLADLAKNNKPQTPSNVHAKVEDSSIKIGWDKVENADCYHIYVSYSINGTYTQMKDSESGDAEFQWYNNDCSAYKACSYGIGKEYIKITAVENEIESDYSEPVCVNIPAEKYFPKMSDIPQPVGLDYSSEEVSSDGDMVGYIYSSMDVDSYVEYLVSAGFEENENSGDYILSKGETVFIIKESDEEVIVGGYIH